MEGGPLDQEMENVIIRTQTDQPVEREVIREDKEDVDMEEGGEGGEVPPTTAEFPSREENEIEKEEIPP